MKIVFTTGGTGGHIFPALSLMEYVKSQDSKNEILFIGSNDRLESTLIPERGYKFIGIDVHSFSKNILKDFRYLKQFCLSYKKCIKILKEERPDIVVAFGGYVTFPVIKAARKLGIKIVYHEQNVMPGKVNKIFKKYADTIFVSFKDSEKYLKGVNVVYSGNPTGSRAKMIKRHDKTRIGFSKNKKLVIIVMGSLGSGTVNEIVRDYLKEFNDLDKEILFIGGKVFYDKVKDVKFPKGVKLVEFYNDLSALMKDADLIVTRAGASTLAEILTIKIPSIIIPSPFVANNHQYYNALDLQNNGYGIMLEEKDLTKESLKNKINEVLKDNNYGKMKDNLSKVNLPDSCDIMYKEIKKIIGE